MSPPTELYTGGKSSAPPMTLWDIEAQLIELQDFRDAAETPEEIAAADLAIREYVQAEVRKVDNIASYLRFCESQEEAAGAEIARLIHRKEAWTKRRERLKNFVKDVMQATGQKKLEGRLASFQLKKNPAAVEVTDLSLVPIEYQKCSLTFPAWFWVHIKGLLPENEEIFTMTTAPLKSEIAKILKQPGGAVAGARLVDSERLEVK